MRHKKLLIISAILLVAALGALLHDKYFAECDLGLASEDSVDCRAVKRDRVLLQRAVDTKNPELCKQIRYVYISSDVQTMPSFVVQGNEAVRQCESSVQRGFSPPLGG